MITFKISKYQNGSILEMERELHFIGIGWYRTQGLYNIMLTPISSDHRTSLVFKTPRVGSQPLPLILKRLQPAFILAGLMQNVSIMITDYQQITVQPTPKTSFISNASDYYSVTVTVLCGIIFQFCSAKNCRKV